MEKLFKLYNLNVNINGIPSLTNFVFNSKNHQVTKHILLKNVKKNFSN